MNQRQTSYILIVLLATMLRVAAQEKKAPVFVSIFSTTPHAQIFVNDVERGTDSCIVKVLPGSHVIRAERKGWRKQEIEVVISDEKEQIVQIPAMEQLFATLEVDYRPYGSTVYINNEQQGVTPLTLKLPVEMYGLKIEKEHYISYNAPVVLKHEGENKQVTGVLQLADSDNIQGVNSFSVTGNFKSFKDNCLVKINKNWYVMYVNFLILNGEKPLEQALSKLLFNQQMIPLEEAYKNYAAGFNDYKTTGDFSIAKEKYIKYQVDTVQYKPRKYIGIHTHIQQKTIIGEKEVLRDIEQQFVYDILHSKVLVLEDIFNPDVLSNVKRELASSELQMAMNDEMVTFGKWGEANMSFPYKKCALLFSDDFKKLVDVDWKQYEDDCLRANKQEGRN